MSTAAKRVVVSMLCMRSVQRPFFRSLNLSLGATTQVLESAMLGYTTLMVRTCDGPVEDGFFTTCACGAEPAGVICLESCRVVDACDALHGPHVGLIAGNVNIDSVTKKMVELLAFVIGILRGFVRV